MTAPKKRDLVAALEALIPHVQKAFESCRPKETQQIYASLNTARALVAEYRKQKEAE